MAPSAPKQVQKTTACRPERWLNGSTRPQNMPCLRPLLGWDGRSIEAQPPGLGQRRYDRGTGAHLPVLVNLAVEYID